MEADFIAVENMLRCFKHALVEDTHRNQNTDSLLTALSIDYTQPLWFEATVLLLDIRKKGNMLTNEFLNKLKVNTGKRGEGKTGPADDFLGLVM